MSNGYTRITLDGAPVGLKFGIPCMKEFAIASEGKEHLFYDGEQLSLFGISKLLHSAYLNNQLIREELPTLKLADFSDWVEALEDGDAGIDELTTAMKVLTESRTVHQLKEAKAAQEEDAPAKKKKGRGSRLSK